MNQAVVSMNLMLTQSILKTRKLGLSPERWHILHKTAMHGNNGGSGTLSDYLAIMRMYMHTHMHTQKAKFSSKLGDISKHFVGCCHISQWIETCCK